MTWNVKNPQPTSVRRIHRRLSSSRQRPCRLAGAGAGGGGATWAPTVARSAVRRQPQWRLGERDPKRQHDQAWQGTRQQHPAPRVGLERGQRIADEVRGRVASRPGDRQQAQDPPAEGARHELDEQRLADDVVGAEQEADQQAQHQQLSGGGCHELQRRERAKGRHVVREDRAAAELVRDRAGQQRADEEACERRAGEEPQPPRRQSERPGRKRKGDADDAEPEAVAKDPAGARGGDPEVKCSQRRIVIGRARIDDRRSLGTSRLAGAHVILGPRTAGSVPCAARARDWRRA